MKPKIKQNQLTGSSKLLAPQSIERTPDILEYPSFSFRFLQKNTGHHLDNCKEEDRLQLICQIVKLSELTWNQIYSSHKHGFGSETIPYKKIKPTIPSHVTKDSTLLALRFSGHKPMIGYRDGATFFVLFLDHNFSVYNHG
jgi:hypothetical protein